MGFWNWLFGKPRESRQVRFHTEHFCVCQSDDGRCVEAWSIFPVPFEPKADSPQVELRAALRHSMFGLASLASQDDFLCAAYLHTTNENADVENRTCYNMGRWTRLELKHRLLRIEGARRTPGTPPVQLRFQAEHYWRYCIAPIASDFEYWTPEESNRLEVHVQKPGVDWLSNAKAVWHASKTAMCENIGKWRRLRWFGESVFGMYVRVGIPKPHWMSKTIEVKPLIDGIVAAMHYQPDASDDVVTKLGGYVECTDSEIEVLLGARDGALLGRHNVFSLWGNSLKVSPRDDLCVAIDIRLSWQSSHESSLAFCVFKVEATD